MAYLGWYHVKADGQSNPKLVLSHIYWLSKSGQTSRKRFSRKRCYEKTKSNFDSKIPNGVADFCNDLHKKLNQIIVKMAAAHTSQNFNTANSPLSQYDHSCSFLAEDKKTNDHK